MTKDKRRRAHQPPQLRVVFDTSVIYTGSASELIRQEAASLIKETKFPDLDVQWYLPEMVRHERQYQMQKKALELLSAIAKVERLLGHNLAITEQILLDSVEKVVSQKHEDLGLRCLSLDYHKVDWHRVALDAAYRNPPFKDGETEKGFRDRIIVESFVQLVADCPKTSNICRLVLVTGDVLLARAVDARTTSSTNTTSISSLEELKGLINTLVSQVDESFLARLKPKADKLFFIPKDESTLFYKGSVRQKLNEKFASELDAPPKGATSRSNRKWIISRPNFVKKTGRRIQWTSRIEIEAEASKTVSQPSTVESPSLQIPSQTDASSSDFNPNAMSNLLLSPILRDINLGETASLSSLAKPQDMSDWSNYLKTILPISSVTCYKGVDAYEVMWSADVTTALELRKPSVDEVRHVGPSWEQVI
jgi:hypothetical protein